MKLGNEISLGILHPHQIFYYQGETNVYIILGASIRGVMRQSNNILEFIW